MTPEETTAPTDESPTENVQMFSTGSQSRLSTDETFAVLERARALLSEGDAEAEARWEQCSLEALDEAIATYQSSLSEVAQALVAAGASRAPPEVAGPAHADEIQVPVVEALS